MVIDYELAWARLGEFVASKTQHGREGLLVEMQRITAECRVPAGDLSRLLRLHGVEVERARLIAAETDPDELEGFGGGQCSASDREFPGHDRTEVHHGGSNGEGRRGFEFAGRGRV